MTDHDNLDDLEREIASISPKALPPAILDALAAEMTRAPRSPWADRCLLGAIGAGLAASVVIVSMLWVQSTTTPAPTTSGPPMAAGGDGNAQRAGDYLAMFARADGGHWDDVVK